MFAWLTGKRSGPPAGKLARILATYPACTPPHIGQNGAAPVPGQPILTLDQCRENLDAHRGAIPRRIELLGETLDMFGIDIGDAYAAPDRFVRALHPMLLAELPPLYRPDLRTSAAREASTRAGDAIVLSFMADLAMLETDVLVRAKRGAFVGLNLDPADRDMLSWRRPCLIGLADRLFPKVTPVYYPEVEWFGYFANMDDPQRLAAPERVMPETWGMVIGGTLLQRLDRDIRDPDLATKMRTTWYGKAA